MRVRCIFQTFLWGKMKEYEKYLEFDHLIPQKGQFIHHADYSLKVNNLFFMLDKNTNIVSPVLEFNLTEIVHLNFTDNELNNEKKCTKQVITDMCLDPVDRYSEEL